MESIGTLEPQTGQVSAQATEPKDKNQNTFTQEEKRLAEKHRVEPKTVRLIAEIVNEHTKDTNGIQQIINLVRDRQEQRAETQDQPEQEQPAELCIDQQTKKRLVSFYKGLDPRTKLAITTLSEIQCLEGINFQISKKEGKLFNQIFDDLESACLETFHREPGDVADIALGTFDSEDVWLCGVWEACRMVLQNT